MKEKIVIVTGGGQGIGACIATSYAKKGAKVIIAEIDKEAGLETEQKLKEQGLEAIFIETDVGNEVSVKNMISIVVSIYGKIDILINNAAINPSGNLSTRKVSEFEDVLSVNVTGMYSCVQNSVPHMIGDGCSIVNIASTRAFMSEANTEAYSASKGAVIALTHSLAISLSHKIRVNSVSPGWIETSQWKKKKERNIALLEKQDHLQHPVGRVGVPEDVASAVLYLSSKAAEFITGTNLIVDGGMTSKMIYVE
ncbi:MAG: oxidoreductase [Candidatus Epulonipiscium fishelsonii]|nr:MAG: oxidoreductase [Epulopiscium sp. AS2M-Bin002]